MQDHDQSSENIVDLQGFRENLRKGVVLHSLISALAALAQAREMLGPHNEISDIGDLSALMEACEFKLSADLLRI